MSAVQNSVESNKPTPHIPATVKKSKLEIHKQTKSLISWRDHYFPSADEHAPNDSTFPPGFSRLESEEYVFIRKTENEFKGDYSDSSHIYDIVNPTGEPIFSAVKTFQYENCDRLLQLDVYILELEGGGVLSVKGNSATICVYTLTEAGDLHNELGKIHNRKDGCCSKHEIDIELEGKPIFHIHPAASHKKGEFEIVLLEGHVSCGRFSLEWYNWLDSSSPIIKYYGVGFSKGMDVRSKALLLGALIFLYFEHFDSNSELRRGFMTCDRVCCLIFGIVWVIIIIFLTVIAIIRSLHSEF